MPKPDSIDHKLRETRRQKPFNTNSNNSHFYSNAAHFLTEKLVFRWEEDWDFLGYCCSGNFSGNFAISRHL